MSKQKTKFTLVSHKKQKQRATVKEHVSSKKLTLEEYISSRVEEFINRRIGIRKGTYKHDDMSEQEKIAFDLKFLEMLRNNEYDSFADYDSAYVRHCLKNEAKQNHGDDWNNHYDPSEEEMLNPVGLFDDDPLGSKLRRIENCPPSWYC